MGNVEVRPATRADVVAFLGECRHTIQGYVAVQDGRPIALGGLAFIEGRPIMFLDLDEPARKLKKTMHKMALSIIRASRESGRRVLFAEVDENEPTAPAWLARLGFQPVDEAGRVMLWRN